MVSGIIGASRQKGMTVGGWALVLMIIGFFGLLSFVMIDIHWEKLKIRAAVEMLKQTFNKESDVSEKKIKVTFDKKLSTDYIEGSRRDELKKLMVFKRDIGTLKVILNYEIRRSFLAGYFISKRFKHEVNIKVR